MIFQKQIKLKQVKKQKKSGFTLIELLVSISLFTIIFIASHTSASFLLKATSKWSILHANAPEVNIKKNTTILVKNIIILLFWLFKDIFYTFSVKCKYNFFIVFC